MEPFRVGRGLMPLVHHRDRVPAGIALSVILTCAAAGAVTATDGAVATGSPHSRPSSDDGCGTVLQAGSQVLTIDVDGTPREVIVHLPPDAPDRPDRPPAVIAFHGYGSSAAAMESVTGLSRLADEHGFVAAYPQGRGSPAEWHFAGNLGAMRDDLRMTEVLMAVLAEQACADPASIVLVGHSMGGGMASDAACRLADRIAGVVLIAALWFELPCVPAVPVPVRAFHAIDDPVLPYAGGPIPNVPPGVPDTLPVETAIAAWAANDGCAPSPATSAAGDGSVLMEWLRCAAPVMLRRLPSGGHDWPAVASDQVVEMVMGGTAAGPG
jgi:polyhydroxybutyrate depolymerase